MHIVMGASGKVGRSIVDCLIQQGQQVKAVVRHPEKTELFEKSPHLSFAVADAFDLSSLVQAFDGGNTVFLLTPESGESNDIIGDTAKIIEHYKSAMDSSKIKRVVGLSSMGAQHSAGTGNLRMSYLLEHGFENMGLHKIFVRPSYYYSNWLNFVSLAREQKILPSFFPIDLKIPMSSPYEVAEFIANIMADDTSKEGVYELQGPKWYSTQDIAIAFSEVLGHEVLPQHIPPAEWWSTIKEFGFTDDATRNFVEMTQAVVDGKAQPQNGTIQVPLKVAFRTYLASQVFNE
ncbi:MAG TPA: NAD(P)H-binding protein [Cytophagales bacterium]|nr:NAD(P)H-binding protein [Cytophagales bacterium]